MTPAYVLVLLVAGAMNSASASIPTSCLNITLNNILGIGDCVGNATNLCASTSPTAAVQGITQITSCVIQGIYKNGSPQGILSALAPLLSLIANSSIAPNLNLGTLGNLQLCSSSGCLGFLTTNDSCVGSINIGLPTIGSFGSCVGNVALTCSDGSLTTANMVQSTVQTIVCILNQLSPAQLSTVLQGIICQLITVINQALQGNLVLQAIFLTFSTTITGALGVQCPSLSSLPIIG